MKFEFKNNFIFVPITITTNKQIITIPHCIIDTGSSKTTFDTDFVEIDFKKPAEIKRLISIGGFEEVLEQEIENLQICNRNLGKLKVQFGDLKNKYGINGFIGNDILKKFKVIINYKTSQIFLK